MQNRTWDKYKIEFRAENIHRIEYAIDDRIEIRSRT